MTNGNCSASATKVVTVSTPPVVGQITGSNFVLVGKATTLADTTKKGVWSSSNTSFATVTTTGVVKGIAAGTCNISYTVTPTTGCSPVIVSQSITVYSSLAVTLSAGKIACNGGSTTLAVTVTGGSGNYQYSLNNGVPQMSNTFTVLAGGYSVVVRDMVDTQSVTKTITVAQPAIIITKSCETNIANKWPSKTVRSQ